ncbi:hypothetical protein ACFOQM_02525 [Paenibacillus sp. GCM10012307]|uniref:Copper amine oxidase-like N-terminal domain-containing protein n=1 Tax=Paenibacillus roseus TaxID=2798579 RepID=A0A934MMQ8_9BACL|nr:hypothetical protein [Paenibacillus roseus]MBJ6360191.1 hypothetical protein [Paenibacillus roseus]
MKKIATLLLALSVVFSMAGLAAAASKNTKVDVQVNQHLIKLDGKAYPANVLLYKGTPYLSIREAGKLFDLDVNIYQKTVYIGQLPAGEVPDAVVDKWLAADKSAQNKKVVLLPKVKAKTEVVLNGYTIKLHGIELKADTVEYKGTTFVSLKSATTILEVPLVYHSRSSTYYVGKVPKEIEYSLKSPLYAEPAGGSNKGWQVLRGHEYEKSTRILFQYNGRYMTVKTEDVRKVDMNKKITWTDSTGKKRTNTVREIYRLFAEFSGPYTSDYFYNTFGDLYADWLGATAINADGLVEDYLKGTGKM